MLLQTPQRMLVAGVFVSNYLKSSHLFNNLIQKQIVVKKAKSQDLFSVLLLKRFLNAYFIDIAFPCN
jgi:hypothetical protein